MTTHPYPTEHDPRTFPTDAPAFYVWRYVRERDGSGRYALGRAHGPYDRADGELALAVAVHNATHTYALEGRSRAEGSRYRGHDAYVVWRDEDPTDSPTLFLVLTVGGPFPWWDVSRALRPRRQTDGTYLYPDTMGPREDSDMDGDGDR